MIFFARWLKGLLTFRPERLLITIVGVGLTIALLACLGGFIASSAAVMTRRALSDVPIDWQVLTIPGADADAIKAALKESTSYKVLEPVGYADAAGFVARTGDTVQTTASGKVLGINPDYQSVFPKEIRRLTGASSGVLVAQQTAANLHVREGDVITVQRVGLPAVQVQVDGVVDLPCADSLFQAVGMPAGMAPQAPPDNVLLIPADQWHTLFDPQSRVRPDSVRMQYHVRIGRSLSIDPDDAYIEAIRMANHFESRTAGSAIVGNNLAARLAGVRADALYARVLFLFLGLPGVMLAMMLTIAIAASGSRHRVREQALFRIRGASMGRMLRFEAMEAVMAGIGGIFFGLAATFSAIRFIAPAGTLENRTFLLWTGFAAAAGFILALAAVIFPAWKQARQGTVAASTALRRHTDLFLWRKIHLDGIMLAIAFFEFWRTAGTGYQVVLAPEGVAQVSVHYEVFIAPLFLWIGGALLFIRMWEFFLGRGRRILTGLLRPIAKNLSGPVALSLIRQRLLVTRGIVLVALAVSFAVSTAVFNTTYNVQSRVDAELTNGADVRISGLTASPPGSKLAELKVLPGVSAAEPMMHRFAYVGHDLQDIFGIDPKHIGDVTHLSNAFFEGGDARSTLAMLADQPDGVLVAEETRNDFQLQTGDLLNLRVQFAADHQYHVVPFRFIGVVREFPTAPKDSFLVVNAAYLARITGSNASEIVLLRTTGDPAELAAHARKTVAQLAGAHVTDIGSVKHMISSGLTAINLHGLTRLELVFAVVFVTGATGLILAIGLTERRRSFAILDALGATGRQMGAFIWSEGLLILCGGSAAGALLGWSIAAMLVRVLTGVFDPPPEHLYISWKYLAMLAVSAVTATTLAVCGMTWISRGSGVEELRKE